MESFFDATRSFLGHLAAVDFSALALACAFQIGRLLARTRAWRNIIAAAYPDSRVRWRGVLGAYLAGVGLNAITPARAGDIVKLFLVKRRVEDSTYPTLAATLVVETLFDLLVATAIFLWALRLGVFPSLDRLPNLPAIDWGWLLRHPLVLQIGVSTLAVLVVVGLIWATRRVREFWHRVAQGFAILRTPSAYIGRVVTWQALSWAFRLLAIAWFLRAFGLPSGLHDSLLVQTAQSLSTIVPITPGGAGTEQGLLLYLFRGEAARSQLLSFSVGVHIVIVVVNLALGVAAVALMTRSLRFDRLHGEAAADRGAPAAQGTQSEPR
jgi:glycosyltransferase 2 family protein